MIVVKNVLPSRYKIHLVCLLRQILNFGLYLILKIKIVGIYDLYLNPRDWLGLF